ncbi:C45 family autoproteolytic acyltransferase/hydolase [Sciscionella sediminilitoris]|uniref:C45 family autoproteolytic acyltransferase/hydolase n=1 Tax=Sciscionella sediminilitoris TaxID=1445613 RepID=UPI0004DF2A53|nr:C45 family peptidase [Sciscionella sp. SE31]
MRLHEHHAASVRPGDRGRAIGAAFAEQIRLVSRLYGEFFATAGVGADTVASVAADSQAALARWSPELAAELEGIAEGAGLPLAAVTLLDGRTEIMAHLPPSAEGECSTMVFNPGGVAPQTMQTWDWHEELAPEGLLLSGRGSSGLRFKLFTEFGVLGKIGLNEAGLGVHFNILSHASDGSGTGVPVHAIARRVIEEATSVEEAIALARSAPVSASTVLTVVARGRSVSIELSPRRTAVIEQGADGWLLHTNHFLDAELSGEDTIPVVESSTELRLDYLAGLRDRLAGQEPAERAKIVSGKGAAPVIMRPDTTLPVTEQWRTLLTIALHTAEFSMSYFPGDPQEAGDNGFLVC